MDDAQDTLLPLRVRPGARFTCHGDGLCCTDIHGLGPLKDSEKQMLSLIAKEVVVEHPEGEAILLTRIDDGACVLSLEGLCQIHTKLGAHIKPRTCQRFPYALVATSSGGRVVTEQRCPCRTMGDREEIVAEHALSSLGVTLETAEADRRVRGDLPWQGHEEITVPAWEELEAGWLTRLSDGEEPEAILEVPPLQGQDGDAWRALAQTFTEHPGNTRYTAALVRFGQVLIELLNEETPSDEAGATLSSPRELTWSRSYDRAEARSVDPGDDHGIYQDWLSDELWCLDWAFHGTFAQSRLELATRLAVARRLAQTLVAAGTRPDRAAAESVSVIELAKVADPWADMISELDADSYPVPS